MYELIAIGDCLIDTHVQIDDAAIECDLLQKHCRLCLDYGSKIPITDSFQSLGGNAPNVAAGISKFGLESAVIGAVGDDTNGEFVVEKMRALNIDTQFIEIDKANKTRYSVVLNFKGERTILSYSQKKNYIWPKDLPKTKWLYYTSLSAGFEKIQPDLMAYLKNNPETKLAINPGSYMIKKAVKYLRAAVAKADLLIVNKEEGEKILEIKKSESAKNIIKGLISLGAKEVIVTDAVRGAYFGDGKEYWHCASFPVKPIAKTGAGDAFSSGFIGAKINGLNNNEALLWGIANSCSVIMQAGAQNGLLDKNGIKKALAKYSNIRPKKI